MTAYFVVYAHSDMNDIERLSSQHGAPNQTKWVDMGPPPGRP